jgi:Tfp pilus assembly protein FimV
MTAVCSWCSASITEGMTNCPSCGANLVPDGDPNVPGLTAVDAASIIRSKSPQQPRSRLMSWLSGEYTTDLPSKAEQQAIAPPDLDVRREILRLELEAEVANLQAEADALRAEAAAEGRSLEEIDAALAAAATTAPSPEGEASSENAEASSETAGPSSGSADAAEGTETTDRSDDDAGRDAAR